LATTKQAERTQTDGLVADEYLMDQVYDALLERGEASKVSEITLEINSARIAFPIVRRIVADSPRFVTIDRLWDISARYLDRSRPTERNLAEVLQAAGKPLSTAQLATELSVIYARGTEVYSALLAKILKNAGTYFKTTDNRYGLTTWLPLIDADDFADVLFDNEITEAALAPYKAAAKGVKWTNATYAESTRAIVEALGDRPVPHRIVGVLAFQALGAKFDALKHLQACLADNGLVWLTQRNGGRWISRAYADKIEAILEARGAELAGEDQSEPAPPPPPVVVAAPLPVVAENAVEVIETPEPVVVTPPLQVTAADLESIARIVADRGAPIDVVELLALQYEVVAGDPSFRTDIESLEARLRGSDQLAYVGAGRFREPNSLPLFVYSLPEYLTFPDLQFVSLDGEIMDEEIEDEGLAGTLRQDILNPLAQDAGDDEGEYTGPESDDLNRLRLVVKAHHKEIGTFPLCQAPEGFFPTDAPVVEVTVRVPTGEAHGIIVNNDLRLAFNLFGLYEFLPADSGAVFYLQATARPYEFRFEPGEEDDAEVYVAPARIAELAALREQAEESGDLATFDLACELLAHYPKGISFVQLMTEVNLVRRVTRRKLASILSNYFCFLQKAGQNLWRFDAKKRDLGTDRAKRKYIKR
jgi:hypothetical protein